MSDLIDVERKEILKNTLQATDEEFNALERLIQIQQEKIISNGGTRNQPSVIIDNFLYHGDLGHAIDTDLLTEHGIYNIINLCDCPVDGRNGLLEILWIPDLEDNLHGQIQRYFDQTNDFIIKCKTNNKKVLIHCQAGISRSSAIILAYLMKSDGYTLEDAYRLLLDKRPIASPNYGFLLELIRYEKTLHDQHPSPVQPVFETRV